MQSNLFRCFSNISRFKLLVCLLVGCHLLGNWLPTTTRGQDTSSGTAQSQAAVEEANQAASGFRKPADWQVKLFAAEPSVVNPVVFTVDNQGRVFACESFRQDRGVTDNRKHDRQWLLADLAAQSVQDRIDYHRRLLGSQVDEYTAHDDRIRLIEDTNADGQADRSIMFAAGFNQLEEGTGAGILVRGDRAYFACIPKLWLLTDADQDGRAEKREALHDGYGVRVAFRGHDTHGLIIGPDGRLYFSIGDRGYNIDTGDGRLKDPESGAVFRCELDGSHLEVFATGLRNPQELAFDDYGYLFTGDNNSDSGDKARWVNVMEGGDSGWRMMYQYLPDRGPFNREKIWEPFSPQTPAYIVPPIANIGDGPSGLTCYPGTGLTGDFANCFFLADFRGGASNSGIRLIRVQPQGAFWTVERNEQPIWNVLATDLQFGPDGALWVSDWVDGWVGQGKGRIYRFLDSAASPDSLAEVQQVLASDFRQMSEAQLASLLTHADRRIRLEAQWELATRGLLLPFQQLLEQPETDLLPRMHAIWGIGQATRLHPELRSAVLSSLTQALNDQSAEIRVSAAQVVGDVRLEALTGRIVGLIGDSDARVQYAACLAVGKLQAASGLLPALAMLEANHDRDPGLRHAGIMALRGIGAKHPQELHQLQRHASAAVRLAAVVALRKLHDPQVADFIRDAALPVRLEAIRAVHDVPELHTQLPRLAELMRDVLQAPTPLPDPLVHRVLNANFRLGTEDAIAAIANFAADARQAEALRLEAIDMLASWGTPGPLDRVMNRFQPLVDRTATPAADILARRMDQLVVGSDELLQATIEAAVKLKVQDVAASLQQIANDVQRSGPLRGRALAGMVKLQGAQALELVQKLASDAQAAVRAEALNALAALDPAAALPALEQAIDSSISDERQQAWDTLAAIDLPRATALIEHGLAEYLAGQQPADVWLNIIEAAEGRVATSSIQALNRFEEELVAQDPLAAYRDCAEGGEPTQGRTLFFDKTELSCVRCHKVAGVGGEVGPDLTLIGKDKDHNYLLQAIVDPDAKIAENFATIVLLTNEGQVISGILKKESAEQIELINPEGKAIFVDPAIVESRRTGKSSMPVDLLKHLTRRELRDLVAYLASLTTP